jgi:hypothetical protein
MKLLIKLLTLASFGTGLFGVIFYNRQYDAWYAAVGLTVTSVIFLATNPVNNK